MIKLTQIFTEGTDDGSVYLVKHTACTVWVREPDIVWAYEHGDGKSPIGSTVVIGKRELYVKESPEEIAQKVKLSRLCNL